MALRVKPKNKNYKRDVADIPECREKSSLDDEYRDFPEEKIWSPNEEVNKWVSFYVFMARAVLTYVQESQGIPHGEALENSCTGDAEQYITDVLHDSNYLPDVALKTLLTQKLPQKLISRWTDPDVVSDTITSDTTNIYKFSSDAAIKTALQLRGHEGILEPEHVYYLLALFAVCPKAFVKLESSVIIPESVREEYENSPVDIFAKHGPKDARNLKAERVNRESLLPDWCVACLNCIARFPGCIVSGKPLMDLGDAWICTVCRHHDATERKRRR